MPEAVLVNRTRFASSLTNELAKDLDLLAQKTIAVFKTTDNETP